jgi:CubicO group peptidase (beta-lactamase class C family)
MKTTALVLISFFLFPLDSIVYKAVNKALVSPTNKESAFEKSNENPDFVIAQIDDIINDEIVKQNLPGVAIAVIKNGKVVHAQGYGYTDIEKKTKVTTNTIFRWASISKPVTAIAALRLDEQKSDFKITDKVSDHVSFWPGSSSAQKKRVTVEHLLMNRSGINHYGKGVAKKAGAYSYKPSVYKSESDGYNAKKAVEVFRDAKLDFEPGTKYLYSTFGFNLLGAVVDQVAAEGYVGFVKKNIAEKAGMTSFNVATGSRTGYQKQCDGRLNTNTIKSVEWKLPGGGWESNIQDLAKFAIGIMDGTFLDNTDRLWSKLSADSKTYYYGVNKAGSGNGIRVFHGGAHDNVRTQLHIYPKEKLGVVVMSYAEYADCNRITGRIYKEYFGKSWSPSTDPVDKCNDDMKSCNAKFAGVWRKSGNDVIVRRGYSHNAFYNEWEYLRQQGYYCDDFEAYTENKELRWDGIFRKGNKKNAMWRNFDQTGFNEKWKEQTAKGYRLVDLETYLVNGKRKWAGLFIEGGGKHALFRNLTHDAFNKKWKEMTAEGRKLIDIEVYEQRGKLYWSGVWREGTDGLLNRNYTSDDFHDLVEKRRAAGYKLIDIETYKSKGKWKWAGLWEKNNADEKLNRGFNYCGLMDKHDSYSNSGYELIDLERY